MIETGEIITGILGVIILLVIISLIRWYRIVDPSEAHLVVTPKGKFVVSADDNIATDGKKHYFAIPSWLPFIGRAVRKMDVTIQELVEPQMTWEKSLARYNVKTSTKYRIKNVKKAAETFKNKDELKKQLKEVIESSVRSVTTNYDVQTTIREKKKIDDEINSVMTDDMEKWGLELINFQLVDFSDTEESKIVSNISKRREVEIEAQTRQENAEKLKQARIKEAESEEKAKEREIAKEKVIGERTQNKIQKIAEQEKIAEQKKYEVIQVQTIKQAEIDKEKAIVMANQNKETEAIMKQQKLLEGEGDKLRDMEKAKGEAAPIREKGFAEAEAKEKLQAALNKFGDAAIRALVAEKIVAMQETVGVETAKALTESDMKVFVGGGKAGEDGFELGKMIEALGVSNAITADAALNKIARPNDMGLTTLGLKSLVDDQKDDKKDKSNKKDVPKSKQPEKQTTQEKTNNVKTSNVKNKQHKRYKK